MLSPTGQADQQYLNNKVSNFHRILRSWMLIGLPIESHQLDDPWAEFANNGFTRSEAQERLLAPDDPRARNVVDDTNLINTAPDNHSSTAGLRLKDYAPRTLWNPLWLHKVVLFGFCALFAAIFTALILLYHFSNVHHGLSSESFQNQYGWTYGPTAREFSPAFQRR